MKTHKSETITHLKIKLDSSKLWNRWRGDWPVRCCSPSRDSIWTYFAFFLSFLLESPLASAHSQTLSRWREGKKLLHKLARKKRQNKKKIIMRNCVRAWKKTATIMHGLPASKKCAFERGIKRRNFEFTFNQ